MIKINKNDSIVDVILKIKNCKEKNISLEFPFGHPILHNYTSLKILKTKSAEKELIIFTNDKTAKRIGKKLGIKYNLITKPDIPESDYSFGEYFLYIIKNYYQEIKNFLKNKRKENPFSKYQKIYTNGKIGFFIILSIVSILLLVFIFYFAVNKTYIYIAPEIETRAKGKNFVFEKMGNDDLSLNSNIIKLKELQKTVNVSTKIITSGIDEKYHKKAKGEVKVLNFTDKETKFRKNSKITNKEGLIFFIDDDFKIPAKKIDENGDEIPGEVIVKATAGLEDINKKFFGEKGNIKSGEKMTFLNLPKEELNNFQVISNSDFVGGKSSKKRILSKQDLENAKKILKGKLEEIGIEEIKKEIEAENKVNNTKYEILGVNGMVKYTDFQYSGIENLNQGDEIEEFEIFGTMKVTAYAFNKEIVMNKLRKSIKEGLLGNIENILNIDEESFTIIHEIWRKENPMRIKATAQVNVLYIQNFLSNKNNFVEKLKYQISGLPKEEAEKILINTGKISNVNIEIRPFFIKNISKIIDNIKFEIK